MQKIIILRTGAFASALAQVLADNKNEVLMYGIEKSEVDDINNNHQNSKYFQEIRLNENIVATNDLKQALCDAKVIVFAVPSLVLPSVCQQINELVTYPVHFINIAKGFDPNSGERLSLTIRKNLNPDIIEDLSGLYGPSIAIEIVQRFSTQVTAVSENLLYAKKVQQYFNSENFSVMITNDFIGVECASALKNVVAIISGMLKGQNASDNTVASFITIGLNEAIKFSNKMGGKLETFLTPAGIGDLILTAMSPKSRNYQFGYEIGKTNDPETVIKQLQKTVEGFGTCRLVNEQMLKLKLNLPLFALLYKILYLYENPQIVINDFLKHFPIE
ncbi:NAD(P)H-dependent glycerol-3-phosphate dehydrogenase [Spiroplasma endosymbiont of Lonchoptera lutea]|uniref:NAD(P)H-dependent glycerol-3-phosphate dehydrogenase n=1 Tax=Spiroplasma endosymbiont of Lonchoptera lutea TaxID=3066297 RepID=UPI0030D11835